MPLYLYKEYAGLPVGTSFRQYMLTTTSQGDLIYIASHKGQKFIIPADIISDSENLVIPASERTAFDKDKALQLIEEAEKLLYDKWMLEETNYLKTFLEENGITVTHSPRKCLDCDKLATHGCYCEGHIWSHEPGY